MNAQAQTYAPPGAANAYVPGKLVPGVHDPLVAEIDRLAREAGVGVRDITGADFSLTDVEIGYLQAFRQAGNTGALGIIYVGQHDPTVSARSRSIVGALIRNFIPARMIMRTELLSDLFDKRRQPNADLIAVPDFSFGPDDSASMRRALASYVMGRVGRGRQTVLGVPSKAALNDVFGAEAPLYLKHFKVIPGVHTA